MENQLEKINTHIFSTSKEASSVVAQKIATLIKSKAAKDKMCVLGLATGSTPTSVYAELIRMHTQEGLSFKNVVTFNLDEYFPMPPDALQSYVRFMKEHLFDSIDILPENIHIPDGTVDKENIADFCKKYEAKIKKLGDTVRLCWSQTVKTVPHYVEYPLFTFFEWGICMSERVRTTQT